MVKTLMAAALLTTLYATDAAAQLRTRPYAGPTAFGGGAPVGMTDGYRAAYLAAELGGNRQDVATVAAAARVRVPALAYGGGCCAPARSATPIDQWIAQLDGISAR
ncbi:hypothetical protein [Azospirillum oleiclasticum]|uniref:Uncharacterized protein n=1 Tax=Azospirillum oleiclasticum TaxID=2735135 RepID=A0ABX2TJP4_9PROT|nr:hypothetical protein [Azospirillum oleiclasticum]NYZ24252.1 hypothetical protein [Azospirillum oleiclasticum]